MSAAGVLDVADAMCGVNTTMVKKPPRRGCRVVPRLYRSSEVLSAVGAERWH
jgi:hypothetical protein